MSSESNLLVDEPIQKSKKNKKKIIGVLLLGGIPLLFILYLVLGPILDILSKDLAAKEMYVISEFVNVRATSDVNSLKMGKLDYGTKVLVYKIKEDWAEVLVDGQKVFISSKYIVEPSVYYTIEGLFGDDRAGKSVNSSKYKLGLFRYLMAKGLTTKISEDIQKTYFKDSAKREAYQIFSEPRGSEYNSTCFADFDGDFLQDAAFILKNTASDKKILLILSFDKNEPLDKSKIIYEQSLDKPWMFIKLAKKGVKYNLSGEGKEAKEKIPVNGLLIGSNRNKDLDDPVDLLLYDGQKFNLYRQLKDK